MNEQDSNLNKCNETIKKTINTKAKASQYLSLITCEIDACCFQNHQLLRTDKLILKAKNSEKYKFSKNLLAIIDSQSS